VVLLLLVAVDRAAACVELLILCFRTERASKALDRQFEELKSGGQRGGDR
jgi:hypothetical protein